MAKVTAAMVKELRERTGAKMLDSKNALVENDGDIEKAIEYLRAKAEARGEKLLDRDRHAAEGTIAFYQHHNSQLGVMVEVNCETDFVSSNDSFQALAKDLALQISSNEGTKYVSREDIPAEDIDAKRAEFAADPDMEGKEGDVLSASIDGKMDQWFAEAVLLEQDFIKADKTVELVIKETIAELGETIKVARFARFAVGELAGEAPEDDD